MKTTVMTIANRLYYTQGMSRAQALKTAWQMVKQGKFYTKVRGVLAGNICLKRASSWLCKRY